MAKLIGMAYQGATIGNTFGAVFAAWLIDFYSTQTASGEKKMVFLPAILMTAICLLIGSALTAAILVLRANRSH
jgi:MFS family permease